MDPFLTIPLENRALGDLIYVSTVFQGSLSIKYHGALFPQTLDSFEIILIVILLMAQGSIIYKNFIKQLIKFQKASLFHFHQEIMANLKVK